MVNKVVFSCFLIVLLSSSVRAFQVDKILSKYPDYGKFNDLLNKTGLYKEINERGTVTVLAVPNEAMGDIASRPEDIIKRVMSTHVMLDYFDVPKIVQLSSKSTMVTNLYQSSGIANNNQGFLNISSTADKKIGFGSAVKGAPIDVKLQKMVYSQPYNVSILQVSGIIYTPGIDGSLAAPPRPAPPANKNGTSPSSSTPAPAPAKKNDTSSSPSPGPSSSDTVADAPSPTASTPAGSPAATPSESPKAADAPSPSTDEKPADAPAPTASSAMRLFSGFMGGLVLAIVSSLATF